MKTRLLFLLFVSFTTSGCGGSWRQTEADRFGLEEGPFSRVGTMITGGRIIEAKQTLAELPSTLREEPQWSYLMGRALLLEGHPDRAVGYLDDAHRRLSESMMVKNDLAVALVEAGRAEQALPLFDEILSAQAGDRDIRINQAVALMKAGRTANAQESLSRIAREHPDWFEARYNLGVTAMAAGDAQTAVFEFRQAARLRSGNKDVLVGLSAACTRFQDPICAEQAIREAISRYPEDPMVLMGWGNHQEDLGNLDDALESYNKAAQLYPDCADCWYCLGRTADRLGDRETAIRALRRHLETVPEGTDVEAVSAKLEELASGEGK